MLLKTLVGGYVTCATLRCFVWAYMSSVLWPLEEYSVHTILHWCFASCKVLFNNMILGFYLRDSRFGVLSFYVSEHLYLPFLM